MICRVAYGATRWIETGGGTNVVDLDVVLTFGITIPHGGGDHGTSSGLDFPRCVRVRWRGVGFSLVILREHWSAGRLIVGRK